MWRGSILLLLNIVALAQPKFELASVRRSGPVEPGDSSSRHGGPGTTDPENITYHRMAMVLVISEAYGVDYDQIFGPEWLGADKFDIKAKVPPGTSKEQIAVDVAGSSRRALPSQGPHRAQAVPVVRIVGGERRREIQACGGDRNGPGAWISGIAAGREVRVQAIAAFKLDFAGQWGSGGAFFPPLPDGQLDSAPTFFDALWEQLGLNLIEKKGLLDVVVVDHVDKIPTGN